jgi:site-specific DNA-methyltransferase (adenine-specific)
VKIERIKIQELTPDPNNARAHDDKNLAAIEGSLKEFGQRKPIVITANNVIAAGNGTVAAAKRLGWTDIEAVRVPADWDSDRIKAFALADNRTAELATWNQEVMASQLLELQEAGFEIEEFGFELAEMPIDPNSVKEDEVPEEVISRASLGDVWQLGKHRVICGDSTDSALMEKLMQGQKADLVFTDPPYRMEAEGGSDQWVGRQAAKVGEAIKDIVDFEPAAFLETLPSYFAGKMNAYIFCNKDLVPDYLNWAISKGYAFNILFWKKPNALPLGSQHRPDTEYIIFIRKNAIWNNGLNGVSYSKSLEFGRDNSEKHPTMKPLGLISNELLISSNKGSLVIDPFLGSGSTLIAAEQTDRICYGFELEPKYLDIILQRWENLTGQKAELVNAGR